MSLRTDPFRDQSAALTAATLAQMAEALAGRSARAFAAVIAALAGRDGLPPAELTRFATAAGADAAAAATPWPAGVAEPGLPDPTLLTELQASTLTSPYRLWAALIAHETALFAYWSYASAHAAPDARPLADDLALAALDRAIAARPARRAAFRSARGAAATDTDPVRAAERRLEAALNDAEGATDEATLHAAQRRSTDALACLQRQP